LPGVSLDETPGGFKSTDVFNGLKADKRMEAESVSLPRSVSDCHPFETGGGFKRTPSAKRINGLKRTAAPVSARLREAIR
jgi:hypothetical protein